MVTKTDIEILFSDHSQALKAREFAKAMIFVYYQNGYELLPPEKKSGRIWYQGRKADCEDFTMYSALWWEYRMTY